MKRIIIAVGVAMITGTMSGQEEIPKTPSEVNEAFLSDLRGFKDERYPGIPARTQPAPFAPSAGVSRSSPGGESVSVASLNHRVPKAAKKAYERGRKFSDQGDVRRAAEEFEKAVALDPEYAAAHGDLGVQYVRMIRFEEAEAQLRQAIALDPYVSVSHSNLGWVLFHSRNFQEAEKSARSALALSINNDRAHFLLGLLLSAAPNTSAEGAWHIKQAEVTIPDVDRRFRELREHLQTKP